VVDDDSDDSVVGIVDGLVLEMMNDENKNDDT
jgi:hypothetical protein